MNPDITMNWIIETPDIFSGLTGVAVLLRLMMATVIGGIVGWERGRHGRAAGLRTHIMVCLGATLASLVGMYTTFYLGASGDPNRVAAQVISGIGFLGVGTIIVGRSSQVTGLTTAAGLWATAAAGLALGVGFYWAAVLTTMFMLVAMTFLARIERRTKDGRLCEHIYVELRTVADVRQLIENTAQWDREIEVVPPRTGCSGNAGVEITFPGQIPEDMIARLEELDYVLFVL